MSHSCVSIITPCYNGEAYLDRYFASILAQTYDNLELIFVNDGSTDRTEQIALSYRDALEQRGIRYRYLYQPNGGQASAMNAGLKEMTGNYLVWPDSDDLLTPDSVQLRAEFLDVHPEYAMVRSNGVHLEYGTDRFLRRISDQENRFREDIFLDLILEKTYCACGCYMVRVDALRTIYPTLQIEESDAGQNWQILIPMAGRYRCGYLDEDLYQVMNRPGSHSRQQRTLEQTLERYAQLRRILENGIALSGRTDADYEKIVRIKYLKILLLVYMRYDDRENADLCYEKLKKERDLDGYEIPMYLCRMHPVQYRIFETQKRIARLWSRVCADNQD